MFSGSLSRPPQAPCNPNNSYAACANAAHTSRNANATLFERLARATSGAAECAWAVILLERALAHFSSKLSPASSDSWD